MIPVNNVRSSLSNWSEIKCQILQGSILGLFLFNIFINDLFFVTEKTDICNFADDNTLNSWGENLKTISENLQHDVAGRLLQWFKINSLKPNLEKFQFMISKKNYKPQKPFVNTFAMENLMKCNFYDWPLIKT